METSRDDFVIAIRSAFLKKETQQRFSLLGLIFFSLIFLIFSSFNLKPINYVKILIKEIVYKSSFIVSVPENFVKKNYLNIKNHFNLYEENKKILNELLSLRGKDLSKQIITLENIKYKKLIDDYFIEDNETVAKVLIDKQSPFLRSIIINKGSKNNIKLGMIVLDEGFLIGKIVEINYYTSRVLLISDINSKIPVSLQPGDIQAIMSGKSKQKGTLQYIKDKNAENINEELLVLTSGAGGLFKSGILIGKIKDDENGLKNQDRIVNFSKDFSQLKYVKVVSFLKEKESLDLSSKNDSNQINIKIEKTNIQKEQQEAFRILLEQKKIADEIRIRIQEENNILKNNNIKLQNELLNVKEAIQQNEIQKKQFKFLQLNLLYGPKCRKTKFNNLYKLSTAEYRACILRKGVKKN
jgi:rod shape-determining protein MreC